MISTGTIVVQFGGFGVACLAAHGVHAFAIFRGAHLRELLRLRGLVLRCDEISRTHPQAALGAESVRVFATGAAVFAAAAISVELAMNSWDGRWRWR